MINPIGSNYPCLEQISMVPKLIEPLNFNCIRFYKYKAIFLSEQESLVNRAQLFKANDVVS